MNSLKKSRLQPKLPEVIYPYGLNAGMFDRSSGPPYIALVDITPEMATHMIRFSVNRTLIPSKVRQYKQDMLDGNWYLTSDALAFLATGENYNGQHRLHAIADSGVTVRMYVMVGADPNTVYFTDVGNKKTPAHFLQMKDFALPAKFAAVSKVIHYLNKQEPMSAVGSRNLNSMQIIRDAEYLKEQGFEQWLSRYYKMWLEGAKNLCPYRIMLGIGWYLYQKDKALTTNFLRKLLLGTDAEQTDPEWQARNRLLAIESTRSVGCYKMMAIIARAWIIKKEGNDGKVIRLTENFPDIWSY